MRTSFAVALLSSLVSITLAQNFGIPNCAGSCVTNFGSCSQIDAACICKSSGLISDLSCCVSKSCGEADQNATIQFAQALCGGYGVTNLPTKAACVTATSTSSGLAAVKTAAGHVGLGVVVAGVVAML